MSQPVVGIIMGSDSDLKIMADAATVLEQFQIPFELTVVSAHRTPQRMVDYASSAAARYIAPVFRYVYANAFARRRAAVDFPLPAGPSMAMMGRG
jgi:5-(carboxyamino)imidazole ribonucleotide mutase